MRTSRGLQITSLIVLSPVVLILLSLLIILFTTLYSQLKIWCSPLLPYYDPSLSKITTTAFSTMTYYNNTSSSIMYENAPESKSSSSSSMTDTTPTRSSSSSSNITDTHHSYSFFRLKNLKRKSSTSLLLAYFGITLFVGIFYFQKIHVQKCQNDQLKRNRIKQWVNTNGKKIKKLIYGLLLFSEETEETATATHGFFMKENHHFNQNDDSYSSKKEHVQQKLFTTPTSTPTNHSHSHRHLVNKKSKKQLQHQRNRSPLGSKKQSHDSMKLLSSQQQQERESIYVINTTEKNNSHDKNYSAYMDDWINVGEKKKKSAPLTTTTYEKINNNSNSINNRVLHHDHTKLGDKNKNDETNMEKNAFVEDSDDNDDDKTIVDDDNVFIPTELSMNNTNELELGSPNLSSTETVVSPDDSFTIKKMNQQPPPSPSTTHIKHWYSPFSTGLTIDMLPKYNDPLTKLDPIQLKRNDLSSFTHHHYDQDKFHLLQSHPFISHSNKLNQHSSSLGAIGQQQHQYASHVQNSSKSNHYSLFI